MPKLTVVVRKAYGAGHYVMCGRAYEPDLLVSWPTGEISVMGAGDGLRFAPRHLLPPSAVRHGDDRPTKVVALARPAASSYAPAREGR